MSQSIVSISNTSIAKYQTSDTVHAQGANFTLSKDVEVMSSNDATDMIDLSPDAKQALQSFLSGGSMEMGSAEKATSSDSGDAVAISVSAATASTTGRQPDYATASDYDISWTAADGETGDLEVEEDASFTTDQQLVPLSPQLQASSANDDPRIATSVTDVTFDEGAAGSSASTAALGNHAGVQDADDGKAALMMLEASLTNPNRYGSAGKVESSPGISLLQEV